MKRVEQTQDGPRLQGGRCAGCGHWMVPARSVCPSCRQDKVSPSLLGPRGTVVHWADLQVPSAGVEAPYHVGMVRLREGPLLFARLAGKPLVGQEVTLAASADNDTYWFETGERRQEV